MKRRVISIVFIIILLSYLVFNSIVFAENVAMSNSSSTIYRGGEFIATVKIKDFEGLSTEGVNAFKGTLNYDKNVFEEITVEEGGNISASITPLNNWDTPTYNPETRELVTTKGAIVKQEQDIMKIVFKVKDNAPLGSTTLSINDAKASNADIEFNLEVTSATVTIAEAQLPDTNTIQNTVTNNTTNSVSPVNIISPNTNNAINTTQPINTSGNIVYEGKLPQTGVNSIIVILIAIIVVNAIIAFVKYKKQD